MTRLPASDFGSEIEIGAAALEVARRTHVRRERPEQSRNPTESKSNGAANGGRDALDDDAARALVRRVRLGDRDALDALVRAFLPGVYGFFCRFFQDRDVAADMTQEVFLRVHHKLSTYNNRFSFRSWLYAIAWNLARDRLRRKARSAPTVPLSSGDEVESSGSGDGEAEAVSTERREWMNRALGRLPAPQRAVLVLREFEGLSYEEMSRLLGWKIGTVKSRLNRARLGLKTTLLDMLPDAARDLGVPDDL